MWYTDYVSKHKNKLFPEDRDAQFNALDQAEKARWEQLRLAAKAAKKSDDTAQ